MSVKPVIRTKRDLEILRNIGKAGVASLHQLHQRFWPDALETAACNTLRRLEKVGWITGHWIDVRKPGEHVFTITQVGARENFTKPEKDQFIIGLPLRSELKHLLYAQDTRLLLESHLAAYNLILAKWQNEREIKGEQFRGADFKSGTPDARATFVNKASGEQFSIDIEIDTGLYFGKMLAEKIDAYAKKVDRRIIWTTLPARVKRIENEIQVRQITHMRVIALPVYSYNCR